LKGKIITLLEARMAAGMSRMELSKASEVPVHTIAQIESGVTPGKLGVQQRLSIALRIPFRQMWPDRFAEFEELQLLLFGEPKLGEDGVEDKA
jgi:transcriptional regulator with XRE-family HTH domain